MSVTNEGVEPINQIYNTSMSVINDVQNGGNARDTEVIIDISIE